MAHFTFPAKPVLLLLFVKLSLARSIAEVKAGDILWFTIARASYEVF